MSAWLRLALSRLGIIQASWLRLPPSRLGNIQASLILLSVCRRFGFSSRCSIAWSLFHLSHSIFLLFKHLHSPLCAYLKNKNLLYDRKKNRLKLIYRTPFKRLCMFWAFQRLPAKLTNLPHKRHLIPNNLHHIFSSSCKDFPEKAELMLLIRGEPPRLWDRKFKKVINGAREWMKESPYRCCSRCCCASLRHFSNHSFCRYT